MPTFTINVTGTASHALPAERACLTVLATDEGHDKQVAADNALAAAKAIDDSIEQIQQESADQDLPSIAHHSKTSISTHSWIPHSHSRRDEPYKEQPRRFKSSITFDVRFRDFVALGKFTARLSQTDHCEIQSISWTLLEATRVSFESRLRMEAARNSLTKAKDYCTVFCPMEKVLRLQPDTIRSESYDALNSLRHTQMARSSPQTELLSFEPQEVAIQSTISVIFKVETEGIDIHLAPEHELQDKEA